MNELHGAGCSAMIIVHDLDSQDMSLEASLRAELTAHPVPAGVVACVCIPVEELEAWFWSDPGTLSRIARRKKAAPPSPHNVRSPKEELIRLSRDAGNKPRYSTNDNPKLAEGLDLTRCAKSCPSFAHFKDFIETLSRSARSSRTARV